MRYTIFFIALLSTYGLLAQVPFNYSTSVLVEGKDSNFDRFRNKPMLLELFSSGCIVCFKKMPYINELQKKFQNEINIVLLGDDRRRLPLTYDKFRKKFNLKMVAVFDSLAHFSFKAPFAPYYIWIDKNGNIQGETDGELVSENTLKRFIEGDYSFLKKFRLRKNFDSKQILNRRAGDIIGRTEFSKEIDSLNSNTPLELAITNSKPFFQAINAPIKSLVLLCAFGKRNWIRTDADFGQVWPTVIVDSGSNLDELLNFKVCYSMVFPGFRTINKLKDILKRDLETHFEIQISVEERYMPCWIVERSDTSKSFLRSNADPNFPIVKSTYSRLEVSASSINSVLAEIEYKTHLIIPIIDETGILWPIDVSFDAVMTDWEDVKGKLQEKGFQVKKSMRPMQVAIIRRS